MAKNRKHISVPVPSCSLEIYDMKELEGKSFPIKGCTIIIGIVGAALISVNGSRFALRNGSLGVFFYDDKIVIDRVSSWSRCTVISLPYGLVEEVIYKVTTADLWSFIDRTPVFPLSDKQELLLLTWIQQVSWTIHRCVPKYKEEMLRSHIYNFLMGIESELMMSEHEKGAKDTSRARSLVTQFLDLVARHCKVRRDVRFYCDKLCIAPSYLFKLTERVLQLSPKELIDKQVVTELKNYIANTDMSVKSIAAEMHFPDTSYMCRFFRRMTGISITEFRNTR